MTRENPEIKQMRGPHAAITWRVGVMDEPLLCQNNTSKGDACGGIAGSPMEGNWADHYLKHICLMADSK